MKTGSSLQEMALDLARQREAKADYVADTRQLRMVVTRRRSAADARRRGRIPDHALCPPPDRRTYRDPRKIL